MRAGDLHHRVTIQQPVESQNSYGEPIATWQDVATVWAAIEPLQGRERFDAQQVVAQVDTRIRIRYRPGITPKMRVLFGTRVFDIQAVVEPETRRRELQLLCRERV